MIQTWMIRCFAFPTVSPFSPTRWCGGVGESGDMKGDRGTDWLGGRA